MRAIGNKITNLGLKDKNRLKKLVKKIGQKIGQKNWSKNFVKKIVKKIRQKKLVKKFGQKKKRASRFIISMRATGTPRLKTQQPVLPYDKLDGSLS